MLLKDPPVEITDRLVMFGSNEYPLYLFKGGGEGALFEGGTGPMGPLLREQLEQAGIAADFIKQVIIPHAHPDHVMAVPSLRKLCPGATVAASKIAAGTLGFEKAVAFFTKMDDAVSEALIQAGTVDERHRREPMDEATIAVDRVIEEGDTIDVDGTSLQVLATPGHSDCSLSFYQPELRLAIISDATPYYMPNHDFWWPNYFTDYAAYLDSMGRLQTLDIEVLCLGHHGAVRGAADVATFLGDAVAATEQYHQRIIDETKAGRSPREIAEQLGSEVHEKTGMLPVDFFQKNCGLMVKLSLKHEGIGGDK